MTQTPHPDAEPGSPWALAIETSNPSSREDAPAASVAGALLGDGRPGPIVEIPLSAGSRHDDGLMPAIEALRERLDARPDALARICVSIGPGGYTGLRVAVTTANLLAEATGAALVGVPSAVVAAAGVSERPAAVALASKRGATHLTVFDDPEEPLGGRSAGVVGAESLEGLEIRVLIADRFLPEPILLRARNLGILMRAPVFSASACLRIGMGLDPVEAGGLRPVYARDPEAVRLWRQRHG